MLESIIPIISLVMAIFVFFGGVLFGRYKYKDSKGSALFNAGGSLAVFSLFMLSFVVTGAWVYIITAVIWFCAALSMFHYAKSKMIIG